MSDKAECYVAIPANSWNGLWPKYEANGVRYVPVTRKTRGNVMTFYYRKPTQQPQQRKETK